MKNQLLTLTLVLITSFTAVASDGPQNVVKLGLSPLIFTNLAFSYERVIVGPLTGIVNFSFMPSRAVPSNVTDAMSADVNDADYSSPFNDMTFSGWSLMPEVRVYPSPAKGAPKGFYLGLYYRITTYKVTSQLSDVAYPPAPALPQPYTLDFEAKFKPRGGGLILGMQWLIKDRVSIDWWMLGIGWGTAKFEVDLTSNGNATLDDAAEAGNTFDGEVDGFEFETEDIDGGVRLTSPSVGWPNFRSGLAVGFAF